MKTWLRIGWAFVWQSALLVTIVAAGLTWMNSQAKPWDGRAVYLAKDTAIVGTPGALVVVLAQPSKFDGVFFVNFMEKLFGAGGPIPWPVAPLAGADAGTALMDPAKAYAPVRFEPTSLADVTGATKDIDGVPYIEKYRKGQIRWVKPSDTVPFDTGFWLFPERKGGMRTATAKIILKARYMYYAVLPNGYLPHADQTIAMANAALAELKTRYPTVPTAVVDGFNPYAMKTSVRSVLDAGADTVVISSILPIHSDFEELRGSFSKVYKEVQAWRAEHNDKPIKIVVADSLSSRPEYLDAYATVFDAAVPPAVDPKQPLTVIITYHGLPVELIKTDYWGTASKEVGKVMQARIAKAAAARGYQNVKFVTAMEGFSEGAEDPKNELLGVGEAFAIEVKAKTPLVVALPIEFLSENTDTLFAHAVSMFRGLPGYTPYQGPPANVDWTKPYQRKFVVGGTTLIYGGAPGADGQALAAKALGNVLIDAVGSKRAVNDGAPRG